MRSQQPNHADVKSRGLFLQAISELCPEVLESLAVHAWNPHANVYGDHQNYLYMTAEAARTGVRPPDGVPTRSVIRTEVRAWSDTQFPIAKENAWIEDAAVGAIRYWTRFGHPSQKWGYVEWIEPPDLKIRVGWNKLGGEKWRDYSRTVRASLDEQLKMYRTTVERRFGARFERAQVHARWTVQRVLKQLTYGQIAVRNKPGVSTSAVEKQVKQFAARIELQHPLITPRPTT